MTSLEIAELTGKQHKKLMRDIRNMEPAWEKVNGLKFELIDYKDPRGRLKPCYLLTKTETLYFFRDRIEAAFRSRSYVGNDQLPPPSLYPRKHRELLRAIVAVSLGLSMRRVDLKALDAAYSVAFPNSTPTKRIRTLMRCCLMLNLLLSNRHLSSRDQPWGWSRLRCSRTWRQSTCLPSSGTRCRNR